MNKKNDKSFVFWLLVVGTIFIIVLLGLMWAGFGKLEYEDRNAMEPSTLVKIIFTIFFILMIFLGFLLFRNQEKKDKRKKTFSTEKLNSIFYVM